MTLSDKALTPAQYEEISAMMLRYSNLVRAHRDRFDFMDDRSPFKGQTYELLTSEIERAEYFAGWFYSVARSTKNA